MRRSPHRNIVRALAVLLWLLAAQVRASDSLNNLSGPGLFLDPCHRLLRTMVPFQKGSTRILDPGEILVENTRVAPAVRDVLEGYQRDGIEPPASLGLLPADLVVSEKWTRALGARTGLPSHEASQSKKISNGTSPVWDVQIEGRRFAFRVAGEYQDLRLSVAASEANEFLGLRTVPVARAAIVAGKRGYLFDFVEGIKLPTLGRKKAISDLLQTGKLDARSYSDAMAFEFLVGNLDADPRNSIILPDGRAQVFDHNYAFAAGIPEYFTNEASLGPVLPEKYTRSLATKLRSLGRSAESSANRRKFLELLEPHLTPVEIQAVEFRLDILLRDLEKRGDSALFP